MRCLTWLKLLKTNTLESSNDGYSIAKIENNFSDSLSLRKYIISTIIYLLISNKYNPLNL